MQDTGETEKEAADSLPSEYSHLYLTIGSVLAAVICIRTLCGKKQTCYQRPSRAGISKIVMMTGDSERTAREPLQAKGSNWMNVIQRYSMPTPEE